MISRTNVAYALYANGLKYDMYEKKVLTIIYALSIFDLYRREFTLVTDHKPLLWFRNAQHENTPLKIKISRIQI